MIIVISTILKYNDVYFTDVIVHTDRFLDVIEPLLLALMLLCFIFGKHNCCWCYVICYFFIFSSGIVNSILSHICGRLYFPMFLFRVGLLTLMNMAFCMVLAKLFSSLPIILKLSIVYLYDH